MFSTARARDEPRPVTLTNFPILIPIQRFNPLLSIKRITALGFILAVIVAAGCAKRAGEQTIPPPEETWRKAMNYFHREKYFQAQQYLKDFALNYSGAPQVDSAQFYMGLCSFQLDDYLTAADEFKRVVSQYPFSKLVGDAAYWEARAYYDLAPSYALDQTYTKQALDAFQRYLEDYAGHALNDSAYKYISLCREKLARKDYGAARLYYDLGEYASCVLYANSILENYYDTSWADPAQYLKARSYEELGDRARARQEYQNSLEKYPSGKHADSARRAVASL